MKQPPTELARILEENERRLLEYADKIRTILVIPICKKHRLEFLSGNGRYFFMNSKGETCSTYDAEGGLCRWSLSAENALSRAHKVLGAQVDQARDLGDLIEDVRKGKDIP